jgi:hypothetical protein
MGRSFLAPPGISTERVAVLRKAFMDTIKNGEFLAEAEKMKLEINPVSGDAVQNIVQDVYRTPQIRRRRGGADDQSLSAGPLQDRYDGRKSSGGCHITVRFPFLNTASGCAISATACSGSCAPMTTTSAGWPTAKP